MDNNTKNPPRRKSSAKITCAVFRALFIRGVFLFFTFICIWYVVSLKHELFIYWLFLITTLPLILESINMIFLIINRSKFIKKVYKWFSPPLFFFLLCACPSVWVFELKLHDDNISHETNVISSILQTISNETFNDTYKPSPGQMEPNQTSNVQVTSSQMLIHSSDLDNNRTFSSPDYSNETSSSFQIKEDIQARIMEQLLVLLLILGRWALPRNGITHSQLSLLLLFNIGQGADILELLEAFQEDEIRSNFHLTIGLLCVWQASLLQFCFTIASTFPELVVICSSLLLQDMPFLAIRLTILLKFKVMSYSIVIFTCKNALVIILQVYRLIIILMEHRREEIEKHESVPVFMPLPVSEPEDDDFNRIDVES